MTSEESRELQQDFAHRFGGKPELLVRVPGRVNLIGDHTDYHEGFVLPMAIDRAIVLCGRRRPDRRLRVHSRVLKDSFEFDLDAIERHPKRWAHYFQGVVSVLASRLPITTGCDILVDADLPVGGGLSSSSALVVGFGALIAHLQGQRPSSRDLALLGRDAEHWYGTTGGIMDQYVISHGRAGHAVLLDCRTITHEDVPLPGDVAVVIANTLAQHNQIASPFAERRRQAEAGLRLLQSKLPSVRTLRDVTTDDLEQYRAALLEADSTGVLYRRCLHVVTENARVRAAAAALAEERLSAVGQLMAESHASLRDNYEVSSPELDAMVTAATGIPGCFGARMTGGGFGGCTVNLVASTEATAFSEELGKRYRRTTGIEPVIFATRPSEGVNVIELD
ncbi:MAG: galactokinase [Chloroflexi bacterium]|nr:galactokinase [Chloroflexota bacterium]